MYQYLVIGRDKSYFVKSNSISNNKHKQGEIIQMFFSIDNIFVLFGGRRVMRQAIGIQMGMNSAPLLADLFLPAYEVDFSKRGSQEIEN